MTAVDADLRRLLGTFYVSFPPVCFVVITNAILADAVFFLPFFLSNRLPRTLRKMCRFFYVLVNTVLFGMLALATTYSCSTADDMCTVKLMHERWCMGSVASSTLFFLLFTLIDRLAEPFFRLSYPPYEHSVIKRWQNAASICILWVCISEADNLAVLLCLAMTIKRSFGAWMPLFTWCMMIGIKTFMVLVVVYTLGSGTCKTVLRKDVVASSILVAMF